MDFTIRRGTRDDIQDMLSLWREAEAVEGVTDNAESIEVLLERDPDALLVADVGGRAAGSLIVGWDGWRGGFYRLAVRPGERRNGIARALVEAGEERLRALGARKISAIVIAEHDHATGFWSATGYERDARVVRYVK
jgi:ribosomal protein S18 acetylase RimI-like enzyme